MKKWLSRFSHRIPAILLLGGLGVAGLVITTTNSVVSLPENQADLQQQASDAALSAPDQLAEMQEQAEDAFREEAAVDDSGKAPDVVPAIEEREGEVAAPFRTVVVDGCTRVNYRHKAVAGHPDRQRCAAHRNLIQMGKPKELAGVNWNSVCLRVDDEVTAFERVRDGIVFGPLAGPDSRVSLTYCRGKARCPGNCQPPRDLFLEAIGAALKKEKPARGPIAKWDPADAAEEIDPTGALEAELREVLAAEQDLTLFKQWSATQRTNGCGSESRPVARNFQ